MITVTFKTKLINTILLQTCAIFQQNLWWIKNQFKFLFQLYVALFIRMKAILNPCLKIYQLCMWKSFWKLSCRCRMRKKLSEAHLEYWQESHLWVQWHPQILSVPVLCGTTKRIIQYTAWGLDSLLFIGDSCMISWILWNDILMHMDIILIKL